MPAGEAAALLRTHADRAEAGVLTDPAALAAVVGVERLAIGAGTTDAAVLRGLLVDVPPGLAGLVAEVVGRVDEGLARREVGRSPDAGMVNAEAGHHAVSTRAAPLRAAVRAAHATWQAFDYYEARYGGRGARFAGSDSAWLVSLAPLEADQAVAQVQWLARVLAARGMPSWLLERHLDDLSAEVRRFAGGGGGRRPPRRRGGPARAPHGGRGGRAAGARRRLDGGGDRARGAGGAHRCAAGGRARRRRQRPGRRTTRRWSTG